jgi:hypothetical protein
MKAEVLRLPWLDKLRELSPRIAAECDNLGQNLSYKMRHHGNALNVWFAPTVHMVGELDKPLAEAPIPQRQVGFKRSSRPSVTIHS